MENESKLEILLRTLQLKSYAMHVAQIDAARVAYMRYYLQQYEVIEGRRQKITPSRRIALFNAAIDRIFSEDLDIRADAINQVRAIDRGHPDA